MGLEWMVGLLVAWIVVGFLVVVALCRSVGHIDEGLGDRAALPHDPVTPEPSAPARVKME